jgi:hypothetical protein
MPSLEAMLAMSEEEMRAMRGEVSRRPVAAKERDSPANEASAAAADERATHRSSSLTRPGVLTWPTPLPSLISAQSPTAGAGQLRHVVPDQLVRVAAGLLGDAAPLHTNDGADEQGIARDRSSEARCSLSASILATVLDCLVLSFCTMGEGFGAMG